MTLAEYQEAMTRVKHLPCGHRFPEWRRIKSERQRTLNHERRTADPAWWQAKCEAVARYRRERAANDDGYRHQRNLQAK